MFYVRVPIPVPVSVGVGVSVGVPLSGHSQARVAGLSRVPVARIAPLLPQHPLPPLCAYE
jgi:hypothetical protein